MHVEAAPVSGRIRRRIVRSEPLQFLMALNVSMETSVTNPKSDDGFFVFYESAHCNPANRYIHHVAHTVAAIGIISILWRPLIGGSLIVIAFLLSWMGHFIFERNAPAFFDPADDKTVVGGVIKKLQVAFGGLVWSGACFLRLFGFGPLVR
jgi:hypothetical protein